MHELGLTQDIVEAISKRVESAPVSRVVIEVGRLSGVLPDALLQCFELCVEGTALEGARIEMVEAPGVAECRACSASVELETYFGYCSCGSSDLEWRSGDEVRVLQIETRNDA